MQRLAPLFLLLLAANASAAVGGYAQATGGGNAKPIVVRDKYEMQDAINEYAGAGGLVLLYTGKFDAAPILADVCRQWRKPTIELVIHDKRDITILGADGSTANFGIRIKGFASNIIVRNMSIGLVPGGANNGDAIGIEGRANHIWIDHNELYSQRIHCPDTPGDDTTFDGLLDIRDNVDNITISYNYIHDHDKVGLNGSSDRDTPDRHITYAHNWYRNVGQRLPLQRGGFAHIYNNYYDGIAEHGINVRMGGQALIEGNWFENARNPVTSRLSPKTGDWELRDNNIASPADFERFNITWSPVRSGPSRDATDWASTIQFPQPLPYAYTAQPSALVKCLAMATAGPGKQLAEVDAALPGCKTAR
ncbi:polysaccharide lyase family 1 protein [Viridibacterium curvum]|uniref:Pectate lyase n=1 Tax=Viridibacterium curvum TaxID=1101404 RepID=A0ABP9QXK7_9RHOO